MKFFLFELKNCQSQAEAKEVMHCPTGSLCLTCREREECKLMSKNNTTHTERAADSPGYLLCVKLFCHPLPWNEQQNARRSVSYTVAPCYDPAVCWLSETTGFYIINTSQINTAPPCQNKRHLFKPHCASAMNCWCQQSRSCLISLHVSLTHTGRVQILIFNSRTGKNSGPQIINPLFTLF